MKYGLAHLSIVPCRAEASDSSEQVTQLLLGETCKVYESKKGWYRIKTMPDNYECWIDAKQFIFISQREFDELNENKPILVNDLVSIASNDETKEMMTVLFGSILPGFENGQFSLGKSKWNYEGSTQDSSKIGPKEKIIENAFLFLNSPYQWGGKSPFGIDCSGFVQVVYKMNGIFLPRDAYQQAEMGQALSFIEEAEEGDLAFFDNEEGRITHVGILLNNNKIIHASGKVRVDQLDHQGIFNLEDRKYSHRLRLICKIY